MQFELTNAPSTFQSLMNFIFNPFLRKYMLVFSNDILIYKKYWEEHVQHVDRVLQLFKEKQIYENTSKCAFRVQEVEYLDHILSHEDVKVDPNKIIEGMTNSQNLEETQRIIRIDGILPQVCQELWSNNITYNNIIKKGRIFLDSSNNQIF
jgi:hypothetical protein